MCIDDCKQRKEIVGFLTKAEFKTNIDPMAIQGLEKLEIIEMFVEGVPLTGTKPYTPWFTLCITGNGFSGIPVIPLSNIGSGIQNGCSFLLNGAESFRSFDTPRLWATTVGKLNTNGTVTLKVKDAQGDDFLFNSLSFIGYAVYSNERTYDIAHSAALAQHRSTYV